MSRPQDQKKYRILTYIPLAEKPVVSSAKALERGWVERLKCDCSATVADKPYSLLVLKNPHYFIGTTENRYSALTQKQKALSLHKPGAFQDKRFKASHDINTISDAVCRASRTYDRQAIALRAVVTCVVVQATFALLLSFANTSL